jgi:hypothetical protein
MGKAIRVSLLLLLLTCPARAGWIQNGTPDPTPPQSSTAQEPCSGGDTQTDVPDALTQIALDLLAALPSLL